MLNGFAPRFALEAGFLVLLGVGAGYADLRPIVIVALLAGGWLLVSLIELATWRAQARTSTLFVPPPAPDAEAEAELEPGPVPEPEHGWPVDDEADAAEGAYPLRADAGTEPAEEIEAYTRVIGSDSDTED